MRYRLLLIILAIPLTSLAQLSSPPASAIRNTSYPVSVGRTDPIFIFCNSSGNEKGSLIAESPGGSAPFDFTWYKWNNTAKDFTDLIKTDLSVSSSTLSALDEGGYKVRITNGGGYDTSLYGWIDIDRPVSIAKLQNFTCDYVALNGTAYVDTFYYNNPVNGTRLMLKNAYAFLWSSDPVSAIPYPNIELNPVTFSPPLEDVTYKLQVTDSFLCMTESSFPYTSIHVKADFTVDPDKGEAPLKVTITDKSIRGSTYKWEFGDHSTDSISNLKDPGPHIYYKPGEYYINLTIKSDNACVGTMQSEKIVVDPSELNIPNVFTPDGDGINDYFVVESKSLRTINVEIFSQSGMMVYSFSGQGQALADWKGWDGNVNNSSARATPGVYFYIIRAAGWDDVIYGGKQYRGFLYLYR